VCASVFVSLSVCLCVSMCVWYSVCVPVSVFLSHLVYVCVCVFLSVSVSLSVRKGETNSQGDFLLRGKAEHHLSQDHSSTIYTRLQSIQGLALQSHLLPRG